MHIGEAMSVSLQALRQNKVRSFLTGLGMMIGTASVILVVTISLTSQSYILEQIEGVGSNMIFASYEVGSQQSSAEVNADFIKMADIQAVREQFANRIVAATGIESNVDSKFTVIGTFKEKVESFGQSELNSETVLIPITVLQYFIRVERIDPMYVQVRRPEDVQPLTLQVNQLLESRHRVGARYKVENLNAIL